MNWPIYVEKGGEPFGFCPGKATWDREAIEQYRLMSLAAESGNILLYSGGIIDQPDWWIDGLSWFLPRYRLNQFVSRARMVLGDGKDSNVKGGRQRGGNNRPTQR